MRSRDLDRAARLAITIAGQMAAAAPGCPAEDLVPAAWPVAVVLTRMRRQAKRDRKAARRYRRLRAEVEAVLRAAEPDSLASIPALMNSVAFDAACWRTALVPGCQVTALEAA